MGSDLIEVVRAATLYADKLAHDANQAEEEGYQHAADDLRYRSAKIRRHIRAVES
jgi:hypothetical protein